jgi:hypothetical protein
VFPLKLQWLLRLPWQSEHTIQTVLKQSKGPIRAVDPAKLLQKLNKDVSDVNVIQILPRLKEGGAFVKFSYGGNTTPEQVESALQAYLKKRRIRPWWSPLQRMRACLVRGKPWVEDMHRLPSTRLKVEFVPPDSGSEAKELSLEQLYSLFRPYGKLADIVPQLPDSKALPKFATVDFVRIGRSVLAKNCLHGYKVLEAEGGGPAGTLLRLTYQKKVKARWIRDWLFSHPRIVIPLFAAIFATLVVAIFDPVRTFFVKSHISKAFHLSDNRLYRWFMSKADDILPFNTKPDDDKNMDAIWDDRKGNIDQLKKWLFETDDTFIIVQGPRGSGIEELVIDQALKDWKNTLIIDCKPITEPRGDSKTIRAMANQVGYRPVLSWMNSISGMVDMAAQGAAGVKTGFSETLDTQLQKIMNTTATALKNIALQSRQKNDKDAHLSDDEYLEAHPEKRPVVVINNFLHRGQESSLVYDKLAEWAARITTADIAHVIFLTKDVSYSKSLTKALPDRVFHQISLSDCTPEVAKRFVLSHLHTHNEDAKHHPNSSSEGESEKPKNYWHFHSRRSSSNNSEKESEQYELDELDSCIAQLGGRLTDLEFFARRIQSGEPARQAVDEIIAQSASEIQKMYLSGPESASSSLPPSQSPSERSWSPEQAWLLVKRLASASGNGVSNGALRYNEVLLDDAFAKTGGDGEAVLRALEQAELISIVSINGRLSSIKPGRPVFLPAFRRLVDDRVLHARMDLAILSRLESAHNKTIEKCETELTLIAKLPKHSAELQQRIAWLMAKISKAQAKIEQHEVEGERLKKVLVSEY